MEKKGQTVFGMSFSVIFSIIIIIFIITTAFFAIRHFLSLDNCAQIGMFYEDIQTEITQAWRDEIYEDTFTVKLPKDVETVCFGSLSDPTTFLQDKVFQDELIIDHPGLIGTYVFLIPKKDGEVCEGLSYKKLNHAQAYVEYITVTNRFFCKSREELSKEDTTINLRIASTDPLVSICPGKCPAV